MWIGLKEFYLLLYKPSDDWVSHRYSEPMETTVYNFASHMIDIDRIYQQL